MNCLLTGASGFIGSRLLKKLSRDGFQVSIIARSKIAGYKTYVCDFEKDQIPEVAFQSVDLVYHLAGAAHDISGLKKDVSKYRILNIDITEKLAQLASRNNVKKFIFISSVKAGGLPYSGYCSSELNQNMPEGIYGKTKREAELKLLEIGKSLALNVSIIRPSLVYGPNMKGNLGLMLSGIKKGWFPPLPKVSNKRSMIHVDDLVMSIVYVSKHESSNNEIYIATDGRIYSSDQIYDLMCIELGNRIPKWRVPRTLFIFSFFGGVNFRRKIKKLFGDECYSSSKLESIGFSAKKTFEDFNESDF